MVSAGRVTVSEGAAEADLTIRMLTQRLVAMRRQVGELEASAREHENAEAALRESEERYRTLAENARDVIYRYRLVPTPHFEYVSPAATRIVGYTPAEHYADPTLSLKIVHPEDRPLLERSLKGESGLERPMVLRWLHKDGRVIWAEHHNWPVYDDAGRLVAIEGITRDVTDRRGGQMLQSQKMEAVGHLAGGVAHDFNNLLTAIMGYCQMGMAAHDPDGISSHSLREIQKAAERGASLCNQLLVFSRHHAVEPKVVNLSEMVLRMDEMLRRLIGEDIELVTEPAQDLGAVRVDPDMFEQVLVNLALNARDAMPEGGRLVVETGNVVADRGSKSWHAEDAPGEHVVLSVSDTGVGMAPNVKEHIFEPFFTTKRPGEGAGLGLYVCYGIISRSHGHIEVNSQPGKGTRFDIYLPRVYEDPVSLNAPHQPGKLPEGSETVLLVEDEQAVREVATTVLRNQGYTVLEAADGVEALALVREKSDLRIDLLFADVIMPQMSGKELADRLREARPGIKVLYTSGYAGDTIDRLELQDGKAEFIEKPFTPVELARKVREVLDR